jgi:hypothetical protein
MLDAGREIIWWEVRKRAKKKGRMDQNNHYLYFYRRG